jgi:hypothetical protein
MITVTDVKYNLIIDAEDPSGTRHDFEYRGLSTDAKPLNAATNSLFLELDTGDFYYYNGTAWAKVGA